MPMLSLSSAFSAADEHDKRLVDAPGMWSGYVVLNPGKAVETSKQKLAQAQIEAQTAVTQAQGQADAQKAMKDIGSLTPEYLRYLFLTKWNGILPTVMTSASSVFDVSGYVPSTTPQPWGIWSQ